MAVQAYVVLPLVPLRLGAQFTLKPMSTVEGEQPSEETVGGEGGGGGGVVADLTLTVVDSSSQSDPLQASRVIVFVPVEA